MGKASKKIVNKVFYSTGFALGKLKSATNLREVSRATKNMLKVPYRFFKKGTGDASSEPSADEITPKAETTPVTEKGKTTVFVEDLKSVAGDRDHPLSHERTKEFVNDFKEVVSDITKSLSSEFNIVRRSFKSTANSVKNRHINQESAVGSPVPIEPVQVERSPDDLKPQSDLPAKEELPTMEGAKKKT